VHVQRPGQNVGGCDDRRGSQSHDEARQEVPKNTTLFMDNGELYSVCGTLDPTGIYRPDPF
jgi:hypothetical protein